MITGLHHVAILCSEKQPALDFYCGTLGFQVVLEYARPERADEILMLEGYGFTIERFVESGRPARPTEPEAYGLRHLALHVDDVRKTVAQIIAAGGADPAESVQRKASDLCQGSGRLADRTA